MNLYALKIRKSDIELLTLLNQGVTPKVEKNKTTYLVFDATWNSEVPNKIVTERELDQMHEVKMHGPMLFALKK